MPAKLIRTSTSKMVVAGVLASLAIALALVPFTAIPLPARAETTTGPSYFYEAPITTNGNQESHYLLGPIAHCTIFGTWDGASVTVQTQLEDTWVWVDTGWSDFVGATLDVAFTKVDMGSGRYRAVVSTAGPGTSLTFYCRWS